LTIQEEFAKIDELSDDSQETPRRDTPFVRPQIQVLSPEALIS